MVHELIEYIEVYHAEKIDGVKTQRINIHYNFIGAIEIPEETEIDQPEASMQTRKGVTLNYQSAT